MNFSISIMTLFLVCGSVGTFAADDHSSASITGRSSRRLGGETKVNLDGEEFCRTIQTKGLPGQPDGERLHCLSFKNGKMTDNTNTFFGNPPEILEYKLANIRILVKRDGQWEEAYRIDGKAIVTPEGAKLEKVANLENRQFCRTVNTDGLFGQPPGKRDVCVSFKDGKMTDNTNTLFGNPPETLPYMVSGKKLFVLREEKWEQVFTIDETTLVNDSGGKLEEKK